jgi:dTDP-4-dehydrorhamnose reductase
LGYKKGLRLIDLRILLIGKTGQLGGSLIALNTPHQFFAPERVELDIESKESILKAIEAYKPDVVINTAAYHNVPQCEIEPQRAFAVNCIALNNLAKICKDKDILLVTFSTDYVFGGEKTIPYIESDMPMPLQMYGISKLSGEQAVQATAPNHSIIIRTCGLYGLSGAVSKAGNFVDKRILDAKTNVQVKIGCDQTVSPTYTADLALALLKLIEHPHCGRGVYHLVNKGACNWYEFTKAIYETCNLDPSLIPVDRNGLDGLMRRPIYSVLANTRAHSLGIELPDWRDALSRYIFDKKC